MRTRRMCDIMLDSQFSRPDGWLVGIETESDDDDDDGQLKM